MLFVIVAEALNALMEKAKHLGLIKGFVIDNADNEVTPLQFADDPLCFVTLLWFRCIIWKLF